ncbi:MAG: hypothetical protein GX225_01720 [Clostridiales bacterium]|nr:hypothetical protein [Clostridiales bacterium]
MKTGKITKKVRLIICCICAMLVLTVFSSADVYAADVNGVVSSVSTTQDSEAKITVTFSSQDLIGAIEAYVQYDSSALEFISGTTPLGEVVGGNGRIKIFIDFCELNTTTVELKFKAKSLGTHNIYLTADSTFIGTDFQSMKLVADTGTVTVTSPITVSSDNTLSNLTVYGVKQDGNTVPGWFWPAFDPWTTNYSLNVTTDITKLAITANATDSAKASVTVSDTTLNIGNNTITITVKAEDGSTKQYVLNVLRAAQEEETPVTEPEPEPETPVERPTITIGSDTYTIIDVDDSIELPEGYERAQVEYKNVQITGAKGLGTGIVLIALSKGDEAPELFVYDAKSGQVYRFTMVQVISASYVILEMDGVDIEPPKGYKLSSIEVDGKMVVAYVRDGVDVCVVYAVDSSGAKDLYYYDTKAKTLMKYFDNSEEQTGDTVDVIQSEVETSDNSNKMEKLKFWNRIILIVSATVILLMIAVIIVLVITVKNSHRKNNEDLDNQNLEELFPEDVDTNPEETTIGEDIPVEENLQEEKPEDISEEISTGEMNLDEISEETPDEGMQENFSEGNLEELSIGESLVEKMPTEEMPTEEMPTEEIPTEEIPPEDSLKEEIDKKKIIEEILEDKSKSLDEKELDMVLDELLDDLLK